MADLNANDIQRVIIPLERDLESMGWDQGFSAWLVHDHDHFEQPELLKVIDRDHDAGPLHMIQSAPPLIGPCHSGLVVSFECWANAEQTESVRYVICGMRSGLLVVVVREENRKPKCRIIPCDTMPNAHQSVVEIFLALRAKVTEQVQTGLANFLQSLLGGGAQMIVFDPRTFRGEQPNDTPD